MVAPSRPDLWPSRQLELSNTNLYGPTTNPSSVPTHHLNNATSTTTHLHIVPVFSTDCSRWWSAVGSRSGAFFHRGGGAHRVQLLELVKYILHNFTQNLNLRLFSAKAARVLLLTVLDEASAAQTTSSTLEDQERALLARNLASKQNEVLTAHTAGTQRQPLTRADLGSRRPKRRGKRGSGACSKAGQPSAEYHPSHLS
jgi:hypothetical protein